MISDIKRFKIIEDAAKDIESVCKKHKVSITACDPVVYVDHTLKHNNGDLSVRGLAFTFSNIGNNELKGDQ